MAQALSPVDLTDAVAQLPGWQLNESGFLVRVVQNPN